MSLQGYAAWYPPTASKLWQGLLRLPQDGAVLALAAACLTCSTRGSACTTAASSQAHLEETCCWVDLASPVLALAMPDHRKLQGVQQLVCGLDGGALASLCNTPSHPLPALVLPIVPEDPGWTAAARVNPLLLRMLGAIVTLCHRLSLHHLQVCRVSAAVA